MKNKIVHIISLGCPKNRVDSELIVSRLMERGCRLTDDIAEAEIIIVNTCAFIESAKTEAVEEIFEAAEFKREGRCKILVVAGCLPQRYGKELFDEMVEADVFIGTYDSDKLPDLIEKFEKTGERQIVTDGNAKYLETAKRGLISTPAHYAYVKIADGCSNRCSYCAIPGIRGNMVSRSIESICAEVAELAAYGVKEIILIAQDTTDYGIDLYGKRKLVDLLKALLQIKDIAWFRVLYMYPKGMTDELLALMDEEERICKYADVPLQHIAAQVMKDMNRHDTPEQVRRVLERLRACRNRFTVRTSLIVGFPGETDEQFEELRDFVAKAKIDRVGVFQYSPEEGTVAAELPNQICPEIKEERYQAVMEVQAEVSRELNRERIGKVYDCIVDEYDEDVCMFIGRSQYEAPEVDGVVYITGENEPEIGSIVKVKITDCAEYDLMGEIVE